MEAIHRILGIPPAEREVRGAVELKISQVRERLDHLTLRDPHIPVILLMLAMNECRVSGAKPAGIVYGLGLIYGIPITAEFGDDWIADAKPQTGPGPADPPGVAGAPPRPGWQALDQDTLVEQLVQEASVWWGAIPPEQTLLTEINYGQLRKAFNRVLDAPPSTPPGPAGTVPPPGTPPLPQVH